MLGLRNTEIYSLKKELLQTRASLQRLQMQNLVPTLPRALLGALSSHIIGSIAGSPPVARYTRQLLNFIQVVRNHPLAWSLVSSLLVRLPIPVPRIVRLLTPALVAGWLAWKIWKKNKP